MKKEWIKPEVSSLGMKNTNDLQGCPNQREAERGGHVCPHYCVKFFGGCGGCRVGTCILGEIIDPIGRCICKDETPRS